MRVWECCRDTQKGIHSLTHIYFRRAVSILSFSLEDSIFVEILELTLRERERERKRVDKNKSCVMLKKVLVVGDSGMIIFHHTYIQSLAQKKTKTTSNALSSTDANVTLDVHQTTHTHTHDTTQVLERRASYER